MTRATRLMWWQELTIIACPAFSSGQLCKPCNDLQLLEGYLVTWHESRNESDPRQFGQQEKFGLSMDPSVVTRQYYAHKDAQYTIYNTYIYIYTKKKWLTDVNCSLSLSLSLSTCHTQMDCMSYLIQVLVYIIFYMKSFASHPHARTPVSAYCVSKQIVTEWQWANKPTHQTNLSNQWHLANQCQVNVEEQPAHGAITACGGVDQDVEAKSSQSQRIVSCDWNQLRPLPAASGQIWVVQSNIRVS